MKDRPTDDQLIGYLYGELNERERAEIEAFMEQHPDFGEELQELKETRELLSKIPDRQVDEPALIVRKKMSVLDRFSRSWVAVAATLLLLITVLYATDFEARWDEQGLRVGFSEAATEDSYSKSEVEELLNRTVIDLSAEFNGKLNDFEVDYQNRLISFGQDNKEQMEESFEKLRTVNQSQINDFVSQMNREQRAEIEKLFAMTQEEQRRYLSGILTEFTGYIEEQRASDLQEIDNVITGLQISSEEKQRQTEQILASIISQVNNQTISD